MLRRLFILGSASVVIAASVAAVVFGASFLALRNSNGEIEEANAVSVSVRIVELEEGYTVERRFVGQVEARQNVALSFELAGGLAALSVEEGDTIESGTVVAQLDTALLDAEKSRLTASRDALAAQLDYAERALERADSLSRQGAGTVEQKDRATASRNELWSRVAEVDAALRSVDIQLTKSVLRAPFRGRVASVPVDRGVTLTPGQPVLTLLDLSDPRLRVGLPDWVQAEDLPEAEVEIEGMIYSAILVGIRPDLDPVTRTRTVIYSVENWEPSRFGQLASLKFRQQIRETGMWVPLDAIQETTGSVWSVFMIDADNRVRPAAVEILHTEAGRAYVRGSFRPGDQMIDVGPQRVSAGQAVRVQS